MHPQFRPSLLNISLLKQKKILLIKTKHKTEDYNSVDSKEVNRIVTTIAFFA